jgi:hypothetical protein
MTVDATVGSPVAGQPGRVSLAFADHGAPVRNLQAWLGMAGHLMVQRDWQLVTVPITVDVAPG